MTTNNTVSVNYTDAQLRTLVEEYITQQRTVLSLKGACDYILYWAIEENQVANPQGSLLEANELHPSDQDRVKHVLETIVRDGRIAILSGEEMMYKWVMK